MAGMRNWLRRRTDARPREALEIWSREQNTDPEPAASAPDPIIDEDLPDADGAQADWTSAPIEAIPPWRRGDRALIDAARSAAAGADPVDPEASAALARDLRRLADLNANSALSDAEFIAGVRALISAAGRT